MRSTITLEKSFVSQHSVHITDVVFIFRLIVDSILSVGQLTHNTVFGQLTHNTVFGQLTHNTVFGQLTHNTVFGPDFTFTILAVLVMVHSSERGGEEERERKPHLVNISRLFLLCRPTLTTPRSSAHMGWEAEPSSPLLSSPTLLTTPES